MGLEIERKRWEMSRGLLRDERRPLRESLHYENKSGFPWFRSLEQKTEKLERILERRLEMEKRLCSSSSISLIHVSQV